MLLLWKKLLFLPENTDFFKQILASRKVRGSWHYKVYFLRLDMCLYLPEKFLLSFIQRENIYHTHHKRCSVKKVLLEISQNSQKNSSARVSFLIKACTFIKKETLVKVFSCKYYEISKNTLFIEHLRWLPL